MLRASRKHLADAGESYFEHMRFAATVGVLAIGAGLACLLHALIPSVCPRTCSRTGALLQDLFADRRRLAAVSSQSSGVVIFVVLTGLSTLTAAVMLACIEDALIAALAIGQAYALPTIYLSQNPGLDPLG
jgi:hypothetical protein